ncbi:coxsackievirus and adenovirus receptor homolog isoform 3-T3 [Leptosomus discolor]
MAARRQAAVAGCLLLVLRGFSAVVEITERRVAAEGSSALLQAPDIENASFTEWEYLRSDTPEIILQYYANSQSPSIYPAYQGRVVFYPKNGSILLQRLQETDSGVYKATVNLMQDKARTTLLEVVKPVPQPGLQYSSNLAGSPIELVCVVPEGTMAFISWKKDGRPLPPDKCYLSSRNNTVLQIRSGEKSDCGSYSCNVSNVISWMEAALKLTVTGLSPAWGFPPALPCRSHTSSTPRAEAGRRRADVRHRLRCQLRCPALSAEGEQPRAGRVETYKSVNPRAAVYLLSPPACRLHHLDAGRRSFRCLRLARAVLLCCRHRNCLGGSSRGVDTSASQLLQNQNEAPCHPELHSPHDADRQLLVHHPLAPQHPAAPRARLRGGR